MEATGMDPMQRHILETSYEADNRGFSMVVFLVFPQCLMWGFPKIWVHPNHPFKSGFSIINHPFWGHPCVCGFLLLAFV